ncbi:TPA: GTP-binding protein, partial [Candidatus Poribacteria bacterium]|nr:GTP-binding protein [Candidatus Poribacteria bacterium]
MSLPVVAIIGRPNVGKSSLFNLIAKKKISVVHDYPGVTRDRIYADIEWDDRCFTIADTGGLDVRPKEELIDQVQHQVEIAVEEAKVLVFLVDVRTGVMPHDLLVAKKLRQINKPVFLVVNKVEGQKFDNDIYDFYRLGLGEPIPISCAQNWGIGDLLEQVAFALPESDVEDVGLSSTIKISIVGR